MLERDLTDFEVRDVPRTAALDDQKAASFTTEEKWLVDFLDRGSGVDYQRQPRRRPVAGRHPDRKPRVRL